MQSFKKIGAKPFRYLGTCTLTMAMVACGGGGDAAGTAQSVESDTATKQALGVPSGWVGRKPLTEVAKKINELEASGALPKLDTSNSIAGPDLDRNGIRDDIDRYIEQQNFMPELKASVQQQARSYQKAITADLNNASAIEAAKNSGIRAIYCMDKRFGDAYFRGNVLGEVDRAAKRLKKLTLNTKNRLLAWQEFDKKMDGQTFKKPPGEACE